MIFTVLLAFAIGATFQTVQPMLQGGFARAGLQFEPQVELLVSFALCLAALAIGLGFLGVQPYPGLMLIAAAAGAARKTLIARITGGS